MVKDEYLFSKLFPILCFLFFALTIILSLFDSIPNNMLSLFFCITLVSAACTGVSFSLKGGGIEDG